MKKYLLLMIVAFITGSMQGSLVDGIAESESLLTGLAFEILATDGRSIDAQMSSFCQALAYSDNNSRQDVDTITISDNYKKDAQGFKKLGDLLDFEAGKKIGTDQPDTPALEQRKLFAQVMAALAYSRRSVKASYNKPLKILKDLIDRAIDSPFESNVAAGVLSRADADLAFYFHQCSSRCVFPRDLNMISVEKPNNSTLYVYLEQYAPLNSAIERVYEVLKKFGHAQVPPVTKSSQKAAQEIGSDESCEDDFIGAELTNLGIEMDPLVDPLPNGGGPLVPSSSHNLPDHSNTPATPEQPVPNLDPKPDHVQPNPPKTTPKNEKNSFFSLRSILAVGSLCCIGAFIYSKYYAAAEEKTEPNVAPVNSTVSFEYHDSRERATFPL